MSRLNKTPMPLYYQVASALEKEFLSGYKPGSKVPTEPELIERFGVSRTTIRQALALLEENGVIIRHSGKGTFLVPTPKIQVALSELTGFVEDMVALGLQSSARVIEIKQVKPGPPITDKLNLSPEAQLVRIERVRLAEDEPISFDVTYLPYELGMKIAQEDLAVHPIFSLLENKYGVELSEADYTIEAIRVTSRISKHLKIPAGSPVLLINRTSYSIQNTPIDYENLYYRADKIRYHMRLMRRHQLLEPSP